MQDDLAIPFFGNTTTILLIFLGALILFDLVLVRWKHFRLGKIGWKRVDYVWLLLALISVVAYTSQARAVLAKYQLSLASDRLDARYSLLRGYLEAYDGSPAICRKFVRSEVSPPEQEFTRIQGEFDQACVWFQRLTQAIPKLGKARPVEIAWSTLPSPPKFAEQMLIKMVERIQQDVDGFNVGVAAYRRLESDSQRYASEEALIVFAPLLLAIALALRITKVTGEIKIERGK